MSRQRNDQVQSAPNAPNEGLLNSAAAEVGAQAAADTGTPEGGETVPVVSEDSSPRADENEGGGQAGSVTAPNPSSPPKEVKKRIQHPCKQNKKVIVGQAIIEFDAEGIAELDTAQAEYLLGIPGYKEIKEDA